MLHLAEKTAKKAGNALVDQRATARQSSVLKARDVKVKGDEISERIIIQQLQQGSQLPILSEERGTIGAIEPGQHYWLVDPLDGTLNYFQGIPLCCVSISLWRDLDPVLGAIYDFNRDELFSAIVGEGAWMNKNRMQVSNTTRKSEAVLCTGFPVNTDFSTKRLRLFISSIQEYKKVRLLGSAALSLAYVACGRVDAYTEENIMAWDVGAGCALVKAAGGFLQIVAPHGIMKPVTVLAKGCEEL